MKNVMLSCGFLFFICSLSLANGLCISSRHKTGHESSRGTCPICFGQGMLSISAPDYFGNSGGIYTHCYPCTNCNGTGQVGGQTKSAAKPKPNNNGKTNPQSKTNNPPTLPAPPVPKPNNGNIPPKPGEGQFKAVMPQFLPGIPSQTAPFGATYKIVLFGDSNSYFMNVYNKLVAQVGFSKNWFEFGEVFRSRNNAYLWDLYNRNTKTYLYVTPQLGVFDAWGRQAGILIKVG